MGLGQKEEMRKFLVSPLGLLWLGVVMWRELTTACAPWCEWPAEDGHDNGSVRLDSLE